MPGVQIIKPDWVVHGEHPLGAPIYSVHISPDSSRLATGGADNKVKIWNMHAIRDESSSTAHMLSASNHHTHTVNCVRWSPCGRYLATCGDDRLVYLLNIGAKYSLTVHGEKEANKENWNVFRLWKGHDKDVLHVAWCQRTSRLASCGVDNQILIWQISEERLPVTRLRFNGMVKGVAWDPIGKYLAAQGTGGEEKSTCIWRVRDWQMEVKTQTPFMQAPDETMFLRLSWSPDGQCLATANAFVRNKNSCALLQRGSGSGDYSAEWENQATFVGWRAPVTVTAFHPKLLKRGNKMDACCAIGGCDGTLTLWSATKGRPLMIINDLFKEQILDITWGGDGYTLSVCSLDGTVTVLVLTEQEIGAHATPQETAAELRKIYGDADGGAEHQLPEDAFQLDLEAPPLTYTPAVQQQLVTRDKQEEVKTASGKRRIMPKVLRNPDADTDAPPPLPEGAVPTTETTTTTVVSNSAHSQNAPQSASPARPAASAAAPGTVHQSQPAAPVAAQQSFSNALLGGQPAPKNSAPAAAAAPQLSTAELQKQKQQAAELQKQQLAESKKRKAQAPAKADGGKEKRAAIDGGAGPAAASQGQVQAFIPHGNLLPPRPQQSAHSRQIHAGTGSNGAGGKGGAVSLFLNATRTSTGWSTLSCTQEEGMAVWSDSVKEPVDVLAGNEKISVVACSDGSIYVYTQAGRRLMPPMLLGSPVSVLEVSESPDSFLLAATCAGRLLMWDLTTQKQVCSVNLAPFLRDMGGIKTAWVTPSGQPVMAMANGHCITYHQGMQALVRVADDHFTASSLFSQVRTALASPDAKKGHLARALELSSTSFRSQAIPAMISMDLAQQQDLSLSHAETLVASAIVLQSGSEFKQWLDVYVGMLVDQELEPRLREVLELLLPSAASAASVGAAGSRQGAGKSSRMFLGMSRRELAQGVLQAMSRKRTLQRCTAEFHLLLREGVEVQSGEKALVPNL